MHVVFIHGPAASGKHTIGSRLARLTGLPLFHNHLAVDTALSLFPFGSPEFRNLRAAIWRAAFGEAAAAGQSFIFTFHPEATVDPALIGELVDAVQSKGGRVHFVELLCSPETVLQRLVETSRKKFGKLTDPRLYEALKSQGAFEFPPLPRPMLKVDTELLDADAAAHAITQALVTER
jgi:hypothetical protein